jgi:hypothetical protein
LCLDSRSSEHNSDHQRTSEQLYKQRTDWKYQSHQRHLGRISGTDVALFLPTRVWNRHDLSLEAPMTGWLSSLSDIFVDDRSGS